MSDNQKCAECGDDVSANCTPEGGYPPTTVAEVWEEEFEGPAPDCLNIFANVIPMLMEFMAERVVLETPALAASNLRMIEEEIREAAEVLEALALFRGENNKLNQTAGKAP